MIIIRVVVTYKTSSNSDAEDRVVNQLIIIGSNQ